MNKKMKSERKQVDLHSADELLSSAEMLLAMDDPKTLRAAVLEAITALEALVHEKVFGALQGQLSDLLIQWLMDKTKMDFDSRLSVLTPFATGLAVEKDSVLWGNYKKAREIRHRVAHTGAKVSKKDARFVLDTVYEWIQYLQIPIKQPLEPRQTIDSNRSTLLMSEFLEGVAQLEGVLYRIMREISGNGPQLHDRAFALRELMGLGIVDRATVTQIQNFRAVRNKLAHGQVDTNGQIDESDVHRLRQILTNIESSLRPSMVRPVGPIDDALLNEVRKIALEQHGI